MFQWISNKLGRGRRATITRSQPAEVDRPLTTFGRETIRRWEAARTDRLNKAHWQDVRLDMQTINADLVTDLPTLRARCTHEVQQNPMIEGCLDTHATDIVGPNGPTLQVQSSSDDYNRSREQIWKEFFKKPDYAEMMDGPAMLRLWVYMLWKCGEYTLQLVTDHAARGPVSLRCLNLHPSRLDTPPDMAHDPLVVMGVKRTHFGRPLSYFVSDPLMFGAFTLQAVKYHEVSRANFIHQFRVVEPGQARGFPWLASSLSTAGDLRDYDSQVMDAARAAADKETLLYADHPNAPYFDANETTSVQRRQLTTIPPGWKPWSGQASQPSAQYVDFRKERQREIGRPVSMPLMKVRMGSEDHNFSAARFDGKVYAISLSVLQAWIAAGALDPLEDQVAREAELAGAIRPRPKRGVVANNWLWPVPPNVDPEKEMLGYQTGLEIGAYDSSDIAAFMGKDFEMLTARRKRTMEMLAKAQLPPAPYWTPKNPQKPGEEGDPNKEASGGAASATGDNKQ
jgi:lambda family phage portal protein